MEDNRLLTGIIEDARNEAEKLLAQAEEQVKQRLQAGKGRIASLQDEDERKIAAHREAVRRRSDSLISSQRRRMALERREVLTRRVLSRAAELLREEMDGPGYPEFLSRCIAEGIIGVDRDEVAVSCSHREELTPGILSAAVELVREETGREVSVKASGIVLADQGVVVSSADGRVSFNNQAAARFRRYDQEIKEIIAKAGLV